MPIIEVHVSAGDKVNAEDPLLTLESDKATMDVPAPSAGTVAEVLVKVGDEVSEGTPILLLAPGDGAVTTPPSLVEQQEPAPARRRRRWPRRSGHRWRPPAVSTPTAARRRPGRTPARACGGWPASSGVDLAAVTASGPKGRITKDDLLAFLKGPAQPPPAAAAAGRAGIPEIPAQDFSKFGPVETADPAADQEGVRAVPAPVVAQRPARHAQRRGRHHRARRLPQAARHRGQGRPNPYRVTLLAFLVKAVVAALKQFTRSSTAR